MISPESNKKLSYRRGTARRAVSKFVLFGVKGFKQQRHIFNSHQITTSGGKLSIYLAMARIKICSDRGAFNAGAIGAMHRGPLQRRASCLKK